MAGEAAAVEIDDFIATDKVLDGHFPPWAELYGDDFQCRWGILDSLGIRRGELVFALSATLEFPSVVALHGRDIFYRLDLVPKSKCEPNPPDAGKYGLPPRVCGSHIHSWPANRDYVINNGFGRLPYRTPLGGDREMTLDQALAITADALNITVTGVQRDCPPPAQGKLL